MKDYNELLNAIVSTIPINKTEYLYGITFVGAPGVGKSTVAKMLSQKLELYVTINDRIRRFLDSVGIEAGKNQPLLESLAYDRTTYMLEHHTSMILDANCLTAYPTVESNFARFNAPCLFIYLKCDEEEILRRIENRQMIKDEDNYSKATINSYNRFKEREKENPFPSEKIFYTIDTTTNLEEQVDLLVEKIKDFIKDKDN